MDPVPIGTAKTLWKTLQKANKHEIASELLRVLMAYEQALLKATVAAREAIGRLTAQATMECPDNKAVTKAAGRVSEGMRAKVEKEKSDDSPDMFELGEWERAKTGAKAER